MCVVRCDRFFEIRRAFSFHISPFTSHPLKNFLFFLASLLGLAWLTERALDFGLSQNFDFKSSAVVSGKLRVEALFQGSSRVALMLNPAIFEQKTGLATYNLGLNGNSIEHQLALLHLWLQHNPKPKVLFLEISPQYLEKSNLGFYSFYFVRQLRDPYFEAIIRQKDPGLLRASYLPLLKYARYNHTLVPEALAGLGRWLRGGAGEDELKKGFSPSPFVRFDDTFDRFRALSPQGFVAETDTGKLANFGRYFRYAHAQGLRVVAYEAPVLNEYLRLHRNRAAQLAQFDSLCRAEGVPFLHLDTTGLSRDRRYFYNANHLNAEGTDRFSSQLAERLPALIR